MLVEWMSFLARNLKSWKRISRYLYIRIQNFYIGRNASGFWWNRPLPSTLTLLPSGIEYICSWTNSVLTWPNALSLHYYSCRLTHSVHCLWAEISGPPDRLSRSSWGEEKAMHLGPASKAFYSPATYHLLDPPPQHSIIQPFLASVFSSRSHAW